MVDDIKDIWGRAVILSHLKSEITLNDIIRELLRYKLLITGDGDNVRYGINVTHGEYMDQTNIRKLLTDNIREICHLSQLQVFATSYYQRSYFQREIDHRIDELIGLMLSQSGVYDKDISVELTAGQTTRQEKDIRTC